MAERLRILVVGSGGREHAYAWRLAQSPSVDIVHVAPGNGGTAVGDKILNVPIAVDDFAALVAHSRKHGLNLVVVGPEAPLVGGIEGFFRAVGIRCFGPSKAAALMEGSKTFSKDFMQRHGIPTAAFRNFRDYEAAKQYLDSISHDVVIKADGLAAGKGVIIPTSKEEAHDALKKIMVTQEFGTAGSQVVIEEFLEGEELSVLTFSDGYTIRSLPPAQDHKRVFDGDQGPNTGGMGCYAPTRVASKELIAQVDREIVQPTIDSMRRHSFHGHHAHQERA
jgi:phosphoribosylamine--glycine ligase / phosphoribosylformylglycinamidine cyclo-ligase